MNNVDIAAALRTLALQIEAPVQTAKTPVPQPAPVPVAVPHPNPFIDIPVQYRHASPPPYAARYDDPLPEGTPGSVKMLITGHVLSKPQPQYGPDGRWNGQGEGFIGYMNRVRFQTTAGPNGEINAVAAHQVTNMLGFAMQAQSALKSSGPTPDSWPFMADEFSNSEKYNPVDPAAAQAAIKAWGEANQRLRESTVAEAAAANAPSPVPVIPVTGPSVTEDSGNAP